MARGGVTGDKGLKMTDDRPGAWMVIPILGGLGHHAMQPARLMGDQVAASILIAEPGR